MATHVHTISRRNWLAGGPTALVLAGTAAATVAQAAAANPDAELIRLCATLTALERRVDDLFDHSLSGLSFEAADAAACVIEDGDIHPLLDRICTFTPSTYDGYKALAQTLAVVSPDYVEVLEDSKTMDDRLAVVLLRGLMGRAGA